MTTALTRVICGSTYSIRDGKYTGHLCKVREVNTKTSRPFVTVVLLDGWGKETKTVDIIPVSYLEA